MSITSKKDKQWIICMSEKWLQLQCFPIGPFSGWHRQLVERQQITVCWARPRARLSICYWCYFKTRRKLLLRCCVSTDCTYRTNYPEKVEEDLDDNDAVANISDVQTAGILLAQQHIRTSLITLIPCLLTITIYSGQWWCYLKKTSLQYSTKTKNSNYVCQKVVIVI